MTPTPKKEGKKKTKKENKREEKTTHTHTHTQPPPPPPPLIFKNYKANKKHNYSSIWNKFQAFSNIHADSMGTCSGTYQTKSQKNISSFQSILKCIQKNMKHLMSFPHTHTHTHTHTHKHKNKQTCTKWTITIWKEDKTHTVVLVLKLYMRYFNSVAQPQNESNPVRQ